MSRADKIAMRRAELEKDITALDEKMSAREARAKKEDGGKWRDFLTSLLIVALEPGLDPSCTLPWDFVFSLVS